jgi:Bifunctional DNA primase/polymerase, N-terminal/Family of unknown function (DUF5906)
MPMSPRPDAWKTACARAATATNMEGVALAWVSAGFAVCPAEWRPDKPKFKGACFDGPDGKRLTAATEDDVRRIWGEFPQALAWMPGGEGNGFFVIDVDASPPHAIDGREAWRKLMQENGGAPTRVHKSPSGGEHWIYQWDPDREIGGKPGDLPPGIDVLGAGKGFIVPGSMPGYIVDRDEVPGKAPDWLYAVLLPKAKRGGARAGAGRKPGAVGGGKSYAIRKLNEARDAILGAVDGTRDATVGKYVPHIGSLIGAGRLGEQAVRDQLNMAALSNGGQPFADKVRRAIDEGIQHPEMGESPDAEGGFLDAEHFVHHGESNQFIYRPTKAMWPGPAVNRRVFPIQDGEKENGDPRYVQAAEWIPRHQAVEQISWLPGEDEFVGDRYINAGGWEHSEGASVYNMYRPPTREAREGDVSLWVNHIQVLYGVESAEHILNWMAHRVQFPGDKLNHALVLGGPPGTGKDTILAPLREAVGQGNFTEASPKNLLERFNPWAQSVVLRISEAKDLGDMDRYAFYDATKTLIAAPPETTWINPKFVKPYLIQNLCGVIITTNYREHGMYLPADDRRHYVVWTDIERTAFEDDHWRRIWDWYGRGGYEACMWFLGTRDLSAFNPKAPPVQTEAFLRIVQSYGGKEIRTVDNALDQMDYPEATTWVKVTGNMSDADREHYNSEKVREHATSWMKACGYEVERNPGEVKRGRWLVNGVKATVYVNVSKVAPADRHDAARSLTAGAPPKPPKADPQQPQLKLVSKSENEGNQ